jgi:4-amino-4-deoxy-L-arabinose transferase-like glycosyltransferase
VTARREGLALAAILLVYLALALGFSLAPPLEGAEELEHYRFIRTLVDTRALPDPYASWGGQYHQAPLYYLLQAPVKALIDDPDFEAVSTRLNPFYGHAFNSVSRDNKNLLLHRQDELFPFPARGTALATFAMRLVSIALGLGIVLAAYGVCRVVWPDRPDRRLLAVAVVAFHPHLVQVTATVNNDILLILLATLALGLTLVQVRDGPSWRLAVALGVVLGAALLAKVNATFLAIPVGVAILSDRRSWRYAAVILALAALIAGWWYLRNWIKYDDPTGGSVLFSATQPGEAIASGALAPDVGWPRLRFAYETFWARFGDGRVSVPDPVYAGYDALLVLSLAGLLAKAGLVARAGWSTIPRERIIQYAVIAVFGLTWIALLVYYASRAWSGIQGRYLLPGMAVWGVLIAAGLDAWTPRRLRWPMTAAMTLAMALTAAVCLWGYYLPAYGVEAAPEAIPHAVAYTFDGHARLMGAEAAQLSARPGDTVRFALYWQALEPTAEDLQTYLHSVDADVVRRDSYPATGNLLSTDWEPGQTWTEEYVIQIPEDAAPQHVYPLIAGLYDPVSERPLAARDAAGNEVTPIVGRVAIQGARSPLDPAYSFGGIIALGSPTLTTENPAPTLCLAWQSLARTPVDYHLAVHVVDAEGKVISQADTQPGGPDYPTGAWAPGEVITRCVPLEVPDLPASDWTVRLGLYNLADFTRLAAQDAAGNRLADDLIVVRP